MNWSIPNQATQTKVPHDRPKGEPISVLIGSVWARRHDLQANLLACQHRLALKPVTDEAGPTH